MIPFFFAGGKGKVPTLTRKGLKKYIDAEYGVFLSFARFMMDELLEYSQGNPPVQANHDCATLDNKLKFMSIGCQLIDPWLHQNHVICIGMRKIDGGDDITGAAMLQKGFLDVFGRELADVVREIVSDVAALSVATRCGKPSKRCMMHVNEKIPRAMCGDLTRSKGGQQVNPFPEGKALMDQFHGTAVYFAYGTRQEKLVDVGKGVAGGAPKTRLLTDNCGTRVAARAKMVRSVVRQNRALTLYKAAYNPPWEIKDEDMEAASEFLCLFDIAKNVTTRAQSEKHCTSALGYTLIDRMLRKVRGDEFEVVDWRKVTANPQLPLVTKQRQDFTETGAMGLSRMTLEIERRNCGNNTEELTGGSVILTPREKQATLLDLRTVSCEQFEGEDGDVTRRECKGTLQVAYKEYGMCADKHKANKAAATAATKANVVELASKASAKTAGLKRTKKAAPAARGSKWSSDEGSSSSDESDVDEEALAVKAAAERAVREKFYEDEFNVVFKNYRRLGESIDWQALSAKLDLKLKPPKNGIKHDLLELWYVDMCKVMKHMCIIPDPNHVLYGHLPQMATTCLGSIGAL